MTVRNIASICNMVSGRRASEGRARGEPGKEREPRAGAAHAPRSWGPARPEVPGPGAGPADRSPPPLSQPATPSRSRGSPGQPHAPALELRCGRWVGVKGARWRHTDVPREDRKGTSPERAQILLVQ